MFAREDACYNGRLTRKVNGIQPALLDNLTVRRRFVTAANKSDLLDGYTAAWSAHDVGTILSYFTDDCVYEDATLGVVNHNKQEFKAFLEQDFRAFPDFVQKELLRFTSGDYACLEWSMTGTHLGDYPGMPVTGKTFADVRGVSVMELSEGKIRRTTDFWDVTSFLRQLGLASAE